MKSKQDEVYFGVYYGEDSFEDSIHDFNTYESALRDKKLSELEDECYGYRIFKGVEINEDSTD